MDRNTGRAVIELEKSKNKLQQLQINEEISQQKHNKLSTINRGLRNHQINNFMKYRRETRRGRKRRSPQADTTSDFSTAIRYKTRTERERDF